MFLLRSSILLVVQVVGILVERALAVDDFRGGGMRERGAGGAGGVGYLAHGCGQRILLN